MPAARCRRCKRKLTDPYSIALGLGPECRAKFIQAGYSLPKPIYRVNSGKVELVGLEGKMEAIPVMEDLDEGHRRESGDCKE